MDNNTNRREDYDYVTEKIKPRTKRKLKRVLEVLGLSVLAAVVFGLTARIVFVKSADLVSDWFGIELTGFGNEAGPAGTQRSEVGFQTSATKPVTKSPDVKATSTPVPVRKDNEPTGSALTEVDDQQTPAGSDQNSDRSGDSVTQAPVSDTQTSDNGASQAGEQADDNGYVQPTLLREYIAMMAELRTLADRVSESLVTVRAYTSGVNWLDEDIETSVDVTGVMMGDNGVELLILTEYEELGAADRIEIRFRDGARARGKVYGKYSDLNLAVVAVTLADLEDDVRAALSYISMAETTVVSEGEPIMALGRPNGYFGAVEYGFILTQGHKGYYTDGVVEMYTTDIGYHAASDGVIVNMNGELVGLIAHDIGDADTSGVCTVLGVESIRPMLLKMLNGVRIPYFGVRTEDIPQDVLANMGVDNGIYVNEVIAYSAAASAGIRKGDVILAVGDELVMSVADFSEILMNLQAGDRVVVEVYRSSQREEPNILLAAKIGYK